MLATEKIKCFSIVVRVAQFCSLKRQEKKCFKDAMKRAITIIITIIIIIIIMWCAHINELWISHKIVGATWAAEHIARLFVLVLSSIAQAIQTLCLHPIGPYHLLDL
jgi:Na+-driven multidrug efflux pump